MSPEEFGLHLLAASLERAEGKDAEEPPPKGEADAAADLLLAESDSARRWADDQADWLAQQFDELTTMVVVLKPSEWAEEKRYLPPQLSPRPGFYRYDVTPYLREIIDCLSPTSPIRELALMKGAQIGGTVGVLENAIGYQIDHVKTSPVMLVTADAELAKLRMESYITPMIQDSGLSHLIRSTDETNTRKTGKTDKKVEWVGGGFLIPFGAVNANKLRSMSIQILLRDEVDGWPDVVGKSGDPMKLTEARTAGFEASRKIFDLSTPLVKGLSKIERRFLRGDQRYYFVRCLACEHPQVLRWTATNPDTGEVSGIVWETDDDGNLIADSVRYLCEACGHPHTNDDKTRLLSPEYGAEWRPTEPPVSPTVRSYHLSALYSPVGMQSWAACVTAWLEAWDEKLGRAKDLGELQVFYNNVLGVTFEVRGQRVRFSMVSSHRRPAYCYGQVPNQFATANLGGPVLLLTAGVDVHKDSLKVSVHGWCRDRRTVLIDYWTLEGDTEQLDNPSTWGRLREIIEEREYRADDGKRYKIQLTLIDSGYRTDTVYRFCGDYRGGVAPVKGRAAPAKGAIVKEFSSFKTPNGTTAFNVTVDLYKDRWSAALRRSWDGQGLQPAGHFNAPVDAADEHLRELTREVKRERIEKGTGKRLGFEWHRPSGASNELWDLLIYNNAALDLIAWDVCRNHLGMEHVNWLAFYEMALERELYFSAS